MFSHSSEDQKSESMVRVTLPQRLFWWPRHCLACGYVTPISASFFRWLSLVSMSNLPLPFTCKDTCPNVGPTQIIQDDLILRSLITSAKTLFQIRSHSQVPGIKRWTYLLGWSPFNPLCTVLGTNPCVYHFYYP